MWLILAHEIKEIVKIEKSEENIKTNDNISNNTNDEDENEVLQDRSNVKDKWNLIDHVINIELCIDEPITVINKLLAKL